LVQFFFNPSHLGKVRATTNLLPPKEFNDTNSYKSDLNFENYHFGCWSLLNSFKSFYIRNHMQEQDWIFLKNTDMKCIRNRKGKTIKFRLKKFKILGVGNISNILYLGNGKSHKKYVGTLYKKNFVRNLEKNCEDYLKNKCSTYKNRKRPFVFLLLLCIYDQQRILRGPPNEYSY
jgi:hypothetical protein